MPVKGVSGSVFMPLRVPKKFVLWGSQIWAGIQVAESHCSRRLGVSQYHLRPRDRESGLQLFCVRLCPHGILFEGKGGGWAGARKACQLRCIVPWSGRTT